MDHVSTRAAVSDAWSEVKLVSLVHFVEAIKTTAFCAHFNSGRLRLKQFLKKIMSSNAVPSNKHCGRDEGQDKGTFKDYETSYAYKLFGLKSWENWHRTSLADTADINRCFDACQKRLACVITFFSFFRAGQRSVALITGSKFLQTVLNCTRREFVTMMGTTTPFVLETHLLFHSIRMVEQSIEAKTLRCFCSYSTVMLLGYTFRRARRQGRLL